MVETRSSLSWTRTFLWCWGALSLAEVSPPGSQILRWYLSKSALPLLASWKSGRAAGGRERLYLFRASPAQGTPLRDTKNHTAIFPTRGPAGTLWVQRDWPPGDLTDPDLHQALLCPS